MHFDDDELHNQENDEQEIGSDGLLAADDLRLPEGANILVRLHALRAWLERRTSEASMEVGKAALIIQQILQEEPTIRPTRRARHDTSTTILVEAQNALASAQQELATYEEAQTLLTECLDHTTPGQRTLVEYYLMLDELVQQIDSDQSSLSAAHLHALHEVQHRVEHVSISDGEE